MIVGLNSLRNPPHCQISGEEFNEMHYCLHVEKLFFVQKFIICEGRFSMAYHYHIKILMHLMEEKPLNMPFCLPKILTKIVANVRKRQNPESGLYHRGLIKMLISTELDKLSIPWDVFSRGIRTKPLAMVLPPKSQLAHNQ
jgi:hypothetical protein